MNPSIINHIILQLDFNLNYSLKLVEDLDEKQMRHTPAPGLENHPAFTIGHLVTARGGIAADLGGEYIVPDGWRELFEREGPGDPRMPTQDLKSYPDKPTLFYEFEQQSRKLKKRLDILRENDLQKDFKWRFSSHLPSTSDMLLFMCINHEAMHLGQLASWRRAMGLPSALAAM